MTETLDGVAAVFSRLAMSDVSVPGTDLSGCAKTTIAAMKDCGVDRIVAVASAGELDHPDGGYRSKEGLPEFLQHVNFEQIRRYEAHRDSGLAWTLVCPGWLNEDIPPGRGRYALESLPQGSDETGYADLALTMALPMDRPESFRKRVGNVSFR